MKLDLFQRVTRGILLIFSAIAGLYFLNTLEPGRWGQSQLIILWCLNIILFAVIIIGAGVCVPSGVNRLFIDSKRYRYSLSQIQIILWTVIILSAFFTVVMARYMDMLYAKEELYNAILENQPADVKIPERLFMVMGISVSALLGKLGLNSFRANRNLKKGADVIQGLKNIVVNSGKSEENEHGGLYVNLDLGEARISDIFMGEEANDYHSPDFTKIQNFIITVIVLIVYCMELSYILNHRYHDISNLKVLPGFGDGLWALIIISHAGYLVRKGIITTSPSSWKKPQNP